MKPYTTCPGDSAANACRVTALVLSAFALLLLSLALVMPNTGAAAAPGGAAAGPRDFAAQGITETGSLAAQPVTGTATVTGTVTSPQARATVGPSDVLTTTPGADAGETPEVPVGVGTSVVSSPNPTDQPAPPAVIPTSGAQNPDDSQPGQPSNPGSPGNQPAQGGEEFPWLPVGLILLAAIVGAGFGITRMRGPARATVTTEGTTEVVRSSTTTVRETTAEPVVYTAAAAAAAVGPREMTCPNCNAANNIDENFCHECGQDLRSTREAVLAAAAPPAAAPEAVVDMDTLPYLETLDRLDEQLEYVLSRPRVLLGTAPGSDIVINADFRGHETVAPVHAELRREGTRHLLRDRGSETGTFTNDVRTEESTLADGDTLRLGEVRFVYHVPETEG